MFIARVEDSGYAMKMGRVGTAATRYFEGLALDEENEVVQEYMVEIRVILSTGG